MKSENISYSNQLSASRDDATRLHNALQTVQNQLLNELHSLRRAMANGSESLVALKTNVQQDTDTWRAGVRYLECRLEELRERMSAQSATQVIS